MLGFKVLDLLMNNEFMTREAIDKYAISGWKKETHSNLYSISASWDQSNKYLLIYCEYDTKQYRDTVYDMEQDTEAENPRKPYQNELRQQFFACYDTSTCTLYLSDFQKKGILQTYLHEQTNNDFLIRERFDSIEGFCNIAQFIKSIRFVQHNTLMNSTGTSIFQQMYGALGLDVPNSSTTKVEYGHSPISRLRNTLESIKSRKDNCEFDSVVIIGTDAMGADVKFSYETLVSNISIDVDRNSNGRYDDNEVFTTLINKIEAKDV